MKGTNKSANLLIVPFFFFFSFVNFQGHLNKRGFFCFQGHFFYRKVFPDAKSSNLFSFLEVKIIITNKNFRKDNKKILLNKRYAQEVFAILEQHLDLHTSQGPVGKTRNPTW